MSYEHLHDRFGRVQIIQDDFLNRIREYRATRDPSILPDIQDANKLDDELEDIARELSHGEAEPPPAALFVPVAAVSTQRRKRAVDKSADKVAVESNSVSPDVSLEKWGTDDDVNLIDAPPQRASPVGLPASNPWPEEPLVDSTTEKPLSLHSFDDEIPFGGTAESLQDTPRSRRKKRLDKFVVMNNASDIAVKRGESPVVVPTFGEVMKNAVDHGDIAVVDSESSVPETYDEPPPTFRNDPPVSKGAAAGPETTLKKVESFAESGVQDALSKKESLRIESIPVSQILAAPPVLTTSLLTSSEPVLPVFPVNLSYISPTPPASPPLNEQTIQREPTYASPTPPSSPPKANLEITGGSEPVGLIYEGIDKKGSGRVSDRSDSDNEKVPTPRKPFSPAAFDAPRRSPARNFSPLGRSNERRRTSMNEEDHHRYWRHIRAERERYEKILSTISQIKEVQDQLKRDFTQTRVKAVGITGEYLFRPRQTPGIPEKVVLQSLNSARSALQEDDEIIEVDDIPLDPPEQGVAEAPEQTPIIENQQGPVSPEDAARQEAPTAWSAWIAGLIEQPKPSEEAPVVVAEPLAVGSPSSRRRGIPTSQSETVFGVTINIPDEPVTLPGKQGTKIIMAVLTIQKYFRRWRTIRKERLASMASIAEIEAVNAREALRQRRRARSRSANRDAWNIANPPVQPEQEEVVEVVD
jgi:hypothetical protein